MNIVENNSFKSHEQVVFCHDDSVGLKAIIAIHKIRNGSSMGGCRMYPYASTDDALHDVLRLSQSMTYKAAINNLNIGGAKAVIIGDPNKISTEKLFKSFGKFVNSFNGRYITVEDVNTDPKCMEWVRSETKYVVGLPCSLGGLDDPSPITALGIVIGMKAAVKHVMGNESLKNIKIAIQGVGHVGYYLCKELYNAGAKLYIADISQEALSKVLAECEATIVDINDIYDLDIDIFSPCAYGAILNDKTIPRLKCKIIAGAANNQLADEEKHSMALKTRGILYAPDYVINACGLVNSYAELYHFDKHFVTKKIQEIYANLLNIFTIAERENLSQAAVAKKIAESHI
jgi:leucine dehydrogenase